MMRIIAVILVILVSYRTSASIIDNAIGDSPIHWALLVAGSSGWYNYRHQADVCHAYQTIHKHGIPDDHIVVMMYDDIANNTQNPTPGTIINKPGGHDVYEGVPKDYNLNDVNPKNFLAVLQGNKTAMEGIGSGRVIESGPDSNVFVFFSDHGATDLIAFPDSELMEVDLKLALESMSKEKKFKQLVFYLEACESGSMFDNYTIDNVFVTTASGPDESSYACYYDTKLETYLGDVYSVNWLQNSDKADFSTETLLKQYHIVKKLTNTSHVHKYMDMSVDKDHLDDFQGDGSAVKQIHLHDSSDVLFGAVPSPEVPMAVLHHRLMATTDTLKRAAILEEISEHIQAQQRMIEVLEATVQGLVSVDPDIIESTMARQGTQVTNWDCYRRVVRHFSNACFSFKKHDYALSLMYIFANICEQQIPTDRIICMLDQQCK